MWRKDSGKENTENQVELSSVSKTVTSVICENREKDEVYDPFEHRDKKNASSDMGSLAHMIKSSLGTGILAMPNAIKNGGLLFGGIGTIIVGILCAHCVHILVRSSHILCRRTKTPKMTYSETAYAAFAFGPKKLRGLANVMKLIVDTALCANSIGGASVYIVFIASSLQQVINYNFEMEIGIRTYIIAISPVLILLSQFKNLKHLVPFSLIANICIAVGLSVTLFYIFNDFHPIKNVKYISRIEQLPKFFATVIFAIEGISVVIPIENSMKKPQHFLGCPSVLNITMTIIISLYVIVGVFGYLKYGEGTESVIILNLDTTSLMGQGVKVLFAVAILFSYGLSFFVPLDIIINAIKKRFHIELTMISETCFRAGMSLFTVIIALSIPDLDPFISLVGAVFLSFLGISIPAIIETISCWERHLGFAYWRLIKNIIIFMFSMLALVTGSTVAILDIIKIYS